MDATLTRSITLIGHYPTRGRSAGRRTVLLRPTGGRILTMNADLTVTLEHEETGARFTVDRELVTV